MRVARRDNAEILVDTSNPVTSTVEVSIPNVTENVAGQESVPTPEPLKATKNESVVTVRLNKDHSCYVGGTYYVFKKNGVYQIPPDVKRILTVAGLLAPL